MRHAKGRHSLPHSLLSSSLAFSLTISLQIYMESDACVGPVESPAPALILSRYNRSAHYYSYIPYHVCSYKPTQCVVRVANYNTPTCNPVNIASSIYIHITVIGYCALTFLLFALGLNKCKFISLMIRSFMLLFQYFLFIDLY